MSDQQRRLFDSEPAPWEVDDQTEQLVATVVFPVEPHGEFDYLVPDRLAGAVEPGRRVRVPLGRSNRLLIGYCVRLETKSTGQHALKALQGVVDQHNLLSPAMLRLTGWIAEHYLCPWGQVIEAVVPAGVRDQAGTRAVKVFSISADAARLEPQKLPGKQAQVFKVLAGAAQPMTLEELTRAAKCTSAPVTALVRKGLISVGTQRTRSAAVAEPHAPRQPSLVLNPEQQTALDTILAALNSRQHQTVLLHGVTGSGKTEIYMQAIREVVQFGRQAIVLVPEISLTPQTLERFRSRFDRVAVLHSHLTDSERHWHWAAIAAGQVQVIVGARSAIFAPAPNLGLIVLDEEHESSFKQEIAPRYHARDVAIHRAQAEGVPLVLGSATPSLESWYRAQVGQYRLIELPRRVLGRPLPQVGTIDLRNDIHSRVSRGAICRQLHAAMDESLRQGGQVILLLNRRGFSTQIQCPACGKVIQCPHCEIALTHHRTEQIALCHYCDYEVPAPTACPDCGFAGIRYGGMGTQRLEAEVHARFPDYSCLRMDTDTMQSRGSHERALAAFREGRVRILLGTQMIAKGLDFPNVTLVGVINADTALHLPDFRAAERTFHLITQVAGRTGRGEKGGRVLVQTFNPDHPAIVAATRHDYAAFAAGELPIRKMFCYPPFASMIRVVVRGPAETTAKEFAAALTERIKAALGREGKGDRTLLPERPEGCFAQKGPVPFSLTSPSAEIRVLGPAPAPFSKLKGLYRFQIQIQMPDGDRLRAAVREATADLKPPDDVQWIADVDPLDML